MITTFWLILGYDCQNRCGCCYVDGQAISQPKFMPIYYAKEILDTMRNAKITKCLLIGGEPTLHPRLPIIISYAHNLGIHTTLVTNGRKLNSRKYLQKLMNAGLSRITISIEGSKASVHNAITQTKSFDETLQGICSCISAKCNMGTLTTIQSMNSEDCVDIVKLLHEEGGTDIAFNCGIPSVSCGGINSQYILPPDAIAKVIENIYLNAPVDGAKVSFNVTIPLCLLPPLLLTQMLDKRILGFGCQMYQGKGVAFDPNGNILPCTHFADFPLLTDGIGENGSFTHKDTFVDNWELVEGIPAQFRQQLWRYPSLRCQSCPYWGGCIGGCPLYWSVYDPRDYIPAITGGKEVY